MGKEIVVRFEARDEQQAREMTTKMGKELLANPVVEDFSVELASERTPLDAQGR